MRKVSFLVCSYASSSVKLAGAKVFANPVRFYGIVSLRSLLGYFWSRHPAGLIVSSCSRSQSQYRPYDRLKSRFNWSLYVNGPMLPYTHYLLLFFNHYLPYLFYVCDLLNRSENLMARNLFAINSLLFLFFFLCDTCDQTSWTSNSMFP